MMGTETTKDAALRLCAEVVEERDALRALVAELADRNAFASDTLKEKARALLARLDGGAK